MLFQKQFSFVLLLLQIYQGNSVESTYKEVGDGIEITSDGFLNVTFEGERLKLRVNSPISWVTYAFCTGPAVHTGACPGDLGLVILFEKGHLPTYELDRSGNLWNGATRTEAPRITSNVVTVFNLRFPQGVTLTLLNAKIYVAEIKPDTKKAALSPLVIVIISLGSLMAIILLASVTFCIWRRCTLNKQNTVPENI